MKKLILLVLACTAIVMTNCTPAAPITPTPAAPAPVAPTASFTHADSLISGNWILDVTEVYSNTTGALVGSVPHVDPSNCHLNLLLVFDNGPFAFTKQCVYGLSCGPMNGSWRLIAGDLELLTER